MTTKIPDYWQEHIKQKIERIHDLQIAGGRSASSFALVTDIHWMCNAHNTAALLEKVMHDCAIPYFLNAGDTVSGCGLCEKTFLYEEIEAYRDSFSAIEDKCILALGNHDMAFSTLDAPNYYAEQLTQNEIFEHVFRHQTHLPNRVFGGDGTYFYVDSPADKMRYIVLNNHVVPSEQVGDDKKPLFWKFRSFELYQEQLDWFAHVALVVPDKDWSVVLCSHENPCCDEESPACAPLIIKIINAFKHRTKLDEQMTFEKDERLNVKISVDFTNGGGDFIAWLCGHIHRDSAMVIDGVNCLSTVNDSFGGQDGDNEPHVVGTDTEHSFDVFTVNKATRTVNVTRVGLGKDRSFKY